jgi:hypothetical protein
MASKVRLKTVADAPAASDAFLRRIMSCTSFASVLRFATLLSTVLLSGWPAAASATELTRMSDKEVEQSNSEQWNRRDRVRFTTQSASHYLNNPRANNEPVVFFFPPVPPPLGSEVPLADPLATGPAAPAGLAPFVNEVFYPLLASRLANGALSAPLRQRLEEYRATKLALQNELRTRLAAAGELEPGARERQLAGFATEQTPRIVALEVAAESLRTDLRRTGLLGLPDSDNDWLEVMIERVAAGAASGSNRRPPRAEILRGAAFFQEGLSVEQRHLLREAALAEEAETTDAPGARMLRFTPAGSQVRLDPTLPPLLQQKIGYYTSAKAALQHELTAVLQDLPPSPGAHADTARRLAAAQAPRFAALDAIAEEIRRDLAAVPSAPGISVAPSLPAELTTRITLYRNHKLEALRTLHAMLIPDARSAPGEGGTRYVAPDGSSLPAGRAAKIQQSVAEFDRTQAGLVAALNKEKAAIRASLAEHMRSRGAPQDRKSVDDLLREFENARQQQELWEKFRDYQAAVLLPGLSPAQRRLLFDGAIVQLGLPLPAGTVVP